MGSIGWSDRIFDLNCSELLSLSYTGFSLSKHLFWTITRSALQLICNIFDAVISVVVIPHDGSTLHSRVAVPYRFSPTLLRKLHNLFDVMIDIELHSPAAFGITEQFRHSPCVSPLNAASVFCEYTTVARLSLQTEWYCHIQSPLRAWSPEASVSGL